MHKKSILYIMNVPWGWIKQRPHFIAEGLSDTFSVDVIFRKSNTIKLDNFVDSSKISGKISCFRNYPFFRISFLRPFHKWLNVINRFLFSIKVIDLNHYDYIWISSPSLFSILPNNLNVPIIYDCMDDMVEIAGSDMNIREYILHEEKRLFLRAKNIFASSNYLAEKLMSRYGYNKEIAVVNNAISDTLFSEVEIGPNECNDKVFTITYVGTISEWFDFELIKESVARFPNIKYDLYGPYYSKPPEIERVYYKGSISHKDVIRVIYQSDALIMPFVVNELIRSVNPVKLYEYIYSGKQIFAPFYGESAYFSDYIHLYKSKEDFFDLLQSVIKGAKKSDIESMRAFVYNNTWKKRCLQINRILTNE